MTIIIYDFAYHFTMELRIIQSIWSIQESLNYIELCKVIDN